jgi:predicted AlkP superfamily phosphohydrolase/phosphomutase
MIPTVALCVDGGDLRVVRSLVQAGGMSATSELLRRSATVHTVSSARMIEPAAWAPLLSGLPLGHHGFHHFEEFDPATMSTRFQQEMQPEPLWLHLPGRGAGTLTLEVPDCHPHPDSKAAECCCWHKPDPPHRPLFTEAALASRLRKLGRPPRFSTHPTALNGELEERLAQTLAGSARFRADTLRAVGFERPLTCVGVHELHAAVHGLGHHGPDPHWFAPERRDPTLLARTYEAVDELIGVVVRQAADAHVVVVLARGSRPANHAGQLLEGLLERAGLLRRRIDAGSGENGSSASAAVAERLRALVPDRRREQLAMRWVPERLQHVMASRRFHDRYAWERTSVFPVPSWAEGFLRLNLAGREAEGIVAPEDAGPLLERVTALVREMVDADSGRPLADEIVRAHERFPGLEAGRLPDLIVTWAGDRPARTARHPTLGTWEHAPRSNLWTEHRGEADVIFSGPRIRSGVEVDGDQLGLAPTLLRLLGHRPPSVMPGEAWTEILGAAPTG